MNVVEYPEKESPTSTTSPSLDSSSPSRSSNDDLSPVKTEWSFALRGKLRQVITDKRAQTGSGDGESELDSPRDEDKCLNPGDILHVSRQERVRKERNRLAAQRMRDRRKRYHETLVTELGGLETTNNTLESEIRELEKERQRLEFTLLNHLSSCTFSSKPEVKVEVNLNEVNHDRVNDSSEWTPAHNVAYLLNSNNNNRTKVADENVKNMADDRDVRISKMADNRISKIADRLAQNSAYTKTDNAAATIKCENDVLNADNRVNAPPTNANGRITIPNMASYFKIKTEPSETNGNSSVISPRIDSNSEQPLDLSTSPKKPPDLPVDLRVPRGIKHKLYIHQSEDQQDHVIESGEESPDAHRKYHKKLRLFPSGHL